MVCIGGVGMGNSYQLADKLRSSACATCGLWSGHRYYRLCGL